MRLTARDICMRSPVIPVLVIDDIDAAVSLAQALVSGGLPVLEITLRTAAAIDSIRAIAKAVPDAIVGAGSVLGADHLQAVADAGGVFAVSPGATPALLDAAAAAGMPLLPGVHTAGEIMRLLEVGIDVMKFFPAEPAGGIAALRALAGPLPQVSFCPTGGVSTANAKGYLALDNVLCVGGSWVAPKDAVAAGDWARIESLAKEAALLSKLM